MGSWGFYESGLIANPHYLRLPKKGWLAYRRSIINKLVKEGRDIKKTRKSFVWAEKWFPLRDKLIERGIDIQKVDEIIRNRHNEMAGLISEWIAARETLKKLAKDPLYIKSEDEEKLPNELVRPLLKIKAKKLQNQVSDLFGSGRLRKLTTRNVRSWPVFTQIINDLHAYLIEKFKKPIYIGLYGHEFLSPNAQKKFHPEWTRYPEDLLQVIASLLQVYYPVYFSGFTANHVKGRVNIHAE